MEARCRPFTTASTIESRHWFRTMARGWNCRWHTEDISGLRNARIPPTRLWPSHTSRCVIFYTLGALMPTNLALDDKLIDEARRIGGHATKKEAVTAALDEYVR